MLVNINGTRINTDFITQYYFDNEIKHDNYIPVVYLHFISREKPLKVFLGDEKEAEKILKKLDQAINNNQPVKEIAV